MDDLNLFLKADGTWITTSCLRRLLESVRAYDARVLFIHTGMTFGLPNPELRRTALLEHLLEILRDLRVPTLCVPTFTFSFCNGESYSVRESRSRMGALNEYIRQLPEARRSRDPLMSCTVIGQDHALVRNIGKHSIGEQSTFDKLHQQGDGVRFLFFGTTASECFTYTHYVEERLHSPYRYVRPFTGEITDESGTSEDTFSLFVRYQGVVPSSDRYLEEELAKRGLLRREPCGASSISSVREPGAYATIIEHLTANPYRYIAHNPGNLDTTFAVNHMVAL